MANRNSVTDCISIGYIGKAQAAFLQHARATVWGERSGCDPGRRVGCPTHLSCDFRDQPEHAPSARREAFWPWLSGGQMLKNETRPFLNQPAESRIWQPKASKTVKVP